MVPGAFERDVPDKSLQTCGYDEDGFTVCCAYDMKVSDFFWERN